jgi:hypothetical protein
MEFDCLIWIVADGVDHWPNEGKGEAEVQHRNRGELQRVAYHQV